MIIHTATDLLLLSPHTVVGLDTQFHSTSVGCKQYFGTPLSSFTVFFFIFSIISLLYSISFLSNSCKEHWIRFVYDNAHKWSFATTFYTLINNKYLPMKTCTTSQQLIMIISYRADSWFMNFGWIYGFRLNYVFFLLPLGSCSILPKKETSTFQRLGGNVSGWGIFHMPTFDWWEQGSSWFKWWMNESKELFRTRRRNSVSVGAHRGEEDKGTEGGWNPHISWQHTRSLLNQSCSASCLVQSFCNGGPRVTTVSTYNFLSLQCSLPLKLNSHH